MWTRAFVFAAVVSVVASDDAFSQERAVTQQDIRRRAQQLVKADPARFDKPQFEADKDGFLRCRLGGFRPGTRFTGKPKDRYDVFRDAVTSQVRVEVIRENREEDHWKQTLPKVETCIGQMLQTAQEKDLTIDQLTNLIRDTDRKIRNSYQDALDRYAKSKGYRGAKLLEARAVGRKRLLPVPASASVAYMLADDWDFYRFFRREAKKNVPEPAWTPLARDENGELWLFGALTAYRFRGEWKSGDGTLQAQVIEGLEITEKQREYELRFER